VATEIELKLEIAPPQVLTLQNHPLLAPLSSSLHTLENVYYDTTDYQLQNNNLGLRTRFNGKDWCQTLKRERSAGDVSDRESLEGLHLRDEWETAIAGSSLELAGLATAGCKQRMIEWLTSLQLKPIFSTHFQRQQWTLIDGDTEVELVLDQGDVRVAGATTPISEIEIELKRGDIATLQRVCRQLQAAMPLTPSNVSKSARGYQLRAAIDMPNMQESDH